MSLEEIQHLLKAGVAYTSLEEMLSQAPLDEALVTKSTVRRFEYCNSGDNPSIPQSGLNEPVQGVILAISYEKGLEYSEIFDYSVTADKF